MLVFFYPYVRVTLSLRLQDLTSHRCKSADGRVVVGKAEEKVALREYHLQSSATIILIDHMSPNSACNLKDSDSFPRDQGMLPGQGCVRGAWVQDVIVSMHLK